MLKVYFKEDIQNTLNAALVLVIYTAMRQGTFNMDYFDGVWAMARHQALVFGVLDMCWTKDSLIAEARGLLE